MSNLTREFISEQTAFDAGDEFASIGEVRDYFTEDNMRAMFGVHCECNQADLDEMAEAIISNEWHCSF